MKGVFVGLITLDCIYQTRKALEPNEKQVAEAMLLAAGGPVTNAAIAFRALGGEATVVGALGCHPLSTVVHRDLTDQGMTLLDVTPQATVPPPFSSIVVNAETGDRAVISRNAEDRPVPDTLPDQDVLAEADCVLIDGHQMSLGHQLAQQAAQRGIPVVIDAGSWKPGFDRILPLADVVIASAAFCPPEGQPSAAAIAYLQALGIPHMAVTQGGGPVLYRTSTGSGELSVPKIRPVDTLGAGDIFHGAFCYAYAQSHDFLNALTLAAGVATASCRFFGTREWIQHLPSEDTE